MRTSLEGAVARISPSAKTTASLGLPSERPGQCRTPGCTMFAHSNFAVTGGQYCCKKCSKSANTHDSECQRQPYALECVLVEQGSPNQCVFHEYRELAEGR